ncbi:MBL fold metallo-hydrolase [Streptomyces griseorubiginosus]|uniref:MBL fold metallo-hydrolase n=1 Tax=Streptomyces griseorubiginosus TaxID=67304 RepID=UPI001AD70D87|nr:MBL fold metallo-hydrolase [Streptomyces griseorubiginosus]MBO4253136.1 MBL fold metallo-hydrolase [Streptomyces griseorubiginosus]
MDTQHPTPNQLDGLVPSSDPEVAVVAGASVSDSRVEWFRAGDEVDSFVIRTNRFDLVVDTMSTPEMFARVVALAPLRPYLQTVVVTTHADYDHYWGNSYLAPSNHLWIASEHARARIVEQQAELDQMNLATGGRFHSVVLGTPHVGISTATVLDGGDLQIHLLPTPGHTPDHLAVHIPELGVVLAGDAAERPLPELWDARSLPALRASLQLLRDLDATIVIPSHGGTTDPEILTDNLEILNEIERRVESGQSLEDLAGHPLPQKQPFFLHCLHRAVAAIQEEN